MLFEGDLLGDGNITHLAFIILYLFALVFWIVKRKSLLSNLMLILTIAYLHMLFVLVFLPIPISSRVINAYRITSAGTPYYNIIPFKNIIKFIYDGVTSGSTGMMVRNIFGNIICFIPFGFLLPCLNKSFLSFKKFIFLALLTPIGIELTQFIISISIKVVYKFADIDDVILNFTGALVGFAILKLLVNAIKKHFKIDFFELLFRQRNKLHLKKINVE